MQCGPPGLLNELIAKVGFFYALALLFSLLSLIAGSKRQIKWRKSTTRRTRASKYPQCTWYLMEFLKDKSTVYLVFNGIF